MMSMLKILSAATVALLGVAQSAFAVDPGNGVIPEPGSLALVGLALAVAIGVAVRKKK